MDRGLTARWTCAALALSLIAPALAPGAPPEVAAPTERRFSAPEVAEDFTLLRSALVEAHAGLYVYRSPRAIARAFEAMSAGLQDSTELDVYVRVARALAVIRDGHTRSLPSQAWMEEYPKSARVLPLRIRWVDGRAWVGASANPSLPLGTELLAIDGRPLRQIVAQITAGLPGDGWIETGKWAQLAAQFELFYYLFVDRPQRFDLEVRRAGGGTAHLVADAVPPAALPPAEASEASPLKLTLLDDPRAALLRIRTFAADEITGAGLDYDEFLTTSFEAIQSAGVRDLLLDLRGNDGGRDSYGALLLSHLVDRPFPYYRRLETRTRGISFWRSTNLDATFNERFAAGLLPRPGGGWVLPVSRHPNLALQSPRPPTFTGRVWVLIDGGTFSTAAELCAVLRSLRRAVFVGEETGGTYEGNSSGTFAILTLPHSGVRVVVPLVRYLLAGRPAARAGRGVLPDHPVTEAAGEGQGKDRALQRTFELVRAAGRKPRP